jgi:hypothetical protein
MRPEPISDDEWDSAEMSVDERSGDDENSQAETVILAMSRSTQLIDCFPDSNPSE